MIKDLTDFIDESYLDSNHAPLYHYTTTYQFVEILESNILKVSPFENPVNGKKSKIVSLTRNKNIDFSYYKPYLDVIIELDKNMLLINKYKILPYDYFIQSGREDKSKSKINRKEPFEFEELILTDVVDIDKYIISVNFRNDSIFDKPVAKILSILKSKNIKVYENGKEY